MVEPCHATGNQPTQWNRLTTDILFQRVDHDKCKARGDPSPFLVKNDDSKTYNMAFRREPHAVKYIQDVKTRGDQFLAPQNAPSSREAAGLRGWYRTFVCTLPWVSHHRIVKLAYYRLDSL